MRDIKYIVIHCTAGSQRQTVENIRVWWRRLGWRRVGYHRLIAADGTVHNLADYSQVTNGVAGFNANSIHIAYMGGVSPSGKVEDNRTDAQKEQMEILVRELHAQYPNAIIQGHRDFSPDKNRDGFISRNEWMKACPSFSVREWLSEIGITNKTS
jgi:N-acetylmuramoyl-L-alanine amidase